MKELIVGKNEAGQRMDRLLHKYLNKASPSFIYRMLRKKNITLNGKKAVGNERLTEGDSIKMYLTDDTIDVFRDTVHISLHTHPISDESARISDAPEPVYGTAALRKNIIYEDEHFILIDKPCGILSQKAKEEDVSLNEYILDYLIAGGTFTEDDYMTFRPSVCNRLDRNTSGLIICGKSLKGLRFAAYALKHRKFDKYYLACIYDVDGKADEPRLIKGFLSKDERTNRVNVSESRDTAGFGDGSYIETYYEPVFHGEEGYTVLKVKLITGKPHQIRAHLSGTGHPIIGDYKYGNKQINDIYKKKYGLRYQLLHSYMLKFPTQDMLPDEYADFGYLSGKVFTAPLPEVFARITGIKSQEL